ncbi:cyclic nucleotide-binding domain-containing protein [Breoghania sp.]|uniref:cyclic nucleotide-binding domain-containing protein n=1 Tax=Breoghania sp. TaxID=2065378 RepID=UPI002622D5D4|nr:cyclic nucleotide-binding domain-containing protein [Breoghania sp.]MDJ0931632.1 cyclic nucleotide-binding domain-containing protein [Breoghania sp.]
MSLARDIPLLRQVPLLGEFSDEQLRLLAFSAENVMATPNDVIYREGERSDASYVIISGEVALSTAGKADGKGKGKKDGGEGETVTCGPGTLLGEMALFIETHRPNTAVAVEQTEMIRIRRALFKRMLQEYPEIAQAMHASLAQRLRSTTGELLKVTETLDALNVTPLNTKSK